MDATATPIKELIDRVEDYSKTTAELVKLTAIDKSAEIISSLTVQIIVFMCVAMFAFIVNIGIAMWLGELIGRPYCGFFIVAGFNALIATLFYFFRQQWIKVPVSNLIIKQMLNKKLL